MSKKINSRAAWAVASLAAVAALSTFVYAQTSPAPAAAAAPAPLDLSTVKPEDAKAYLTDYGFLIGQRVAGVKPLGLTTDEIDTIAAGRKLAVTANMTDDPPGGQAQALKMQDYLRARADKVSKEEEAKQTAASTAFFANLDKDPNVKKTADGLYYTIVSPGTDPKPTNNDTVTVKYKGSFINGTVFDQTDDKDPTRDFPVDGVIPGWTEGLKLIGKGGVLTHSLPRNLAYGEEPPSPVIPAGATLIFETTIVDIKPTPAPDASSMQLTPDMLKSLGGAGGGASAPAPTSTKGN